MTDLSGYELLRFWESSNLSQRRLAKHLGVGFNSLHGKIFRAQQEMKLRTSTLKTEEYDRVLLKAAVFDIETTDFGTGGMQNFMICTSILPLDSDEVVTYALDFEDQRDDQKILEQTLEDLYQYDILIGHNIAAFDFNWLNSRSMYHRLPPLSRRWLYYDTFQAAKRMAIKAKRKSLAFLCDYFRIPYIKTAIMPVAHSMIASTNEGDFDEALEDIIFHCEQDVLSNRRLFDALWAYDNKGLLNLPMTKKW